MTYLFSPEGREYNEVFAVGWGDLCGTYVVNGTLIWYLQMCWSFYIVYRFIVVETMKSVKKIWGPVIENVILFRFLF